MVEGFASAYALKKDYQRLAGIWRAFVERFPSELKYRRNLIQAYLLSEDAVKAIEIIQDTREVFPAFEKEGERMLKEIYE
ncbi:MAG: hypothetical protein Q8R26_00455 [bacterium]|nr:hypothetical protein [bacterium]